MAFDDFGNFYQGWGGTTDDPYGMGIDYGNFSGGNPDPSEFAGYGQGGYSWQGFPSGGGGGGGGAFNLPGFPNFSLPGMIGTGLDLAGANQMYQAYQRAAQKAEEAGKFTPYNVYSGMGTTSFGPGGVTSSLSPEASGLQSDYLAAARSAAAGSQNPNDIANQTYALMRQQASPFEEEARANLRANLAQTGTTGLGIGADIGGAGPANPQMAALLKAQSDADIQRQLQSYTLG